MGKLTINTTSAQDARIAKAFGKYLNTTTPATYDEDGNELTPETPRNATGGEVKRSVINYIKGIVFAIERKDKISQVSVDELEPS